MLLQDLIPGGSSAQEAACTSLAGRLGAEGGQGCAKKVPGLAGLWGKKPGQHPGPYSSCTLRTYKIRPHGSPGHSPAPMALGQEHLLCGRRPGCGCSPPSPCPLACSSPLSTRAPGPTWKLLPTATQAPVAQHHFLRFPRRFCGARCFLDIPGSEWMHTHLGLGFVLSLSSPLLQTLLLRVPQDLSYPFCWGERGGDGALFVKVIVFIIEVRVG